MSPDRPDGVAIRPAGIDDHVAVSRVLDGALLEVSELERRLADGTVLVATTVRTDERGDVSRTAARNGSGGTVVGAIVVAPEGSAAGSPLAGWPSATHVRAIAVTRRRRRSGIGSALLATALAEWEPLLVDFDPEQNADAESFYAAFGASASEVDDAAGIGRTPEVELRDGPDGRRWALLRDGGE